jgi:hypothetical protein
MQTLMINMKKNLPRFNRLRNKIQTCLGIRLYFGKHPSSVPENSVIFFPCTANLLTCGLVGIVYVKQDTNGADPGFQMPDFKQFEAAIIENTYAQCIQNNRPLSSHYIGSNQTIKELLSSVQALKKINIFQAIYNDKEHQTRLTALSSNLKSIIDEESETLYQGMGRLSTDDAAIISNRIEMLKDAVWILNADLIENIHKIEKLDDNQIEKLSNKQNVHKHVKYISDKILKLKYSISLDGGHIASIHTPKFGYNIYQRQNNMIWFGE